MNETMTDIYAMRRANGDWFAFEDHGRVRVPLFHSSHDALMARLRNFGMLLFHPVALDARLLREIIPVSGERQVSFRLVTDPFANLTGGSLVEPAEMALLIGGPPKHQTTLRNGNGFRASGIPLPRVAGEATETWEDEGGSYAKCA
jgi:hypothetical protein